MEPCRIEINDEIRNLDLKEKEVEFADGACEAYAGGGGTYLPCGLLYGRQLLGQTELDILKKDRCAFLQLSERDGSGMAVRVCIFKPDGPKCLRRLRT